MTKTIVTGGAGFIGVNIAARLLRQGHHVTVFDNLSRDGSERNLKWLQALEYPGELNFVQGDIRDYETMCKAFNGMRRVYHLAGQVAVTTSVSDPREDFEINALGTFNALEAARHCGDDPVFLFSSTNKVYGGLEDLKVVKQDGRYQFADLPNGVSEERGLDFHSPYGCSKGAGDQYVRDYARIYGLRSVVFRQSCIYGYHQYGMEDQGWVAWFVLAVLQNKPITIYGDGCQIRDLLFIEDLMDAYDVAVEHIDVAAGNVFNIGGGPANTMSVWTEFGPILEELAGRTIEVDFSDWRPGDQRIFVSDIRKAKKVLSWEPKVGVKEGIAKLYEWARTHCE